MRILASAALLVLAATAARADQCAYVTKEQAERAAHVLKLGSEFVEYCEPSRTPPPTRSQKVETVTVGHPQLRAGGPVNEAYWAVTVNGMELDVAYVFVRRDERWENVAMLAGCPVVDVKATFDFRSSGAAAEPRAQKSSSVRCTIRSRHAVIFDGPCRFRSEPGGTFSVSSVDPQGDIFQGIVSVSVGVVAPGEAEVRGLTAGGVNSRWGEAHRSKADPACWVGSDFEVCARRLAEAR